MTSRKHRYKPTTNTFKLIEENDRARELVAELYSQLIEHKILPVQVVGRVTRLWGPDWCPHHRNHPTATRCRWCEKELRKRGLHEPGKEG